MLFAQYKPAKFQPPSVDGGCLVGVQDSLLLINLVFSLGSNLPNCI